MSTPHAHLNPMNKTSVKFQNDLNKVVRSCSHKELTHSVYEWKIRQRDAKRSMNPEQIESHNCTTVKQHVYVPWSYMETKGLEFSVACCCIDMWDCWWRVIKYYLNHEIFYHYVNNCHLIFCFSTNKSICFKDPWHRQGKLKRKVKFTIKPMFPVLYFP